MSGPVSPRQAQIEAFLHEEQRRERRAKTVAECMEHGHIYSEDDFACARCGEVNLDDPYGDDIPF